MTKLLVFSLRYSILLFLPSIVCAQNPGDRVLLSERDIVIPVHPTPSNSSVSYKKLTTWQGRLIRCHKYLRLMTDAEKSKLENRDRSIFEQIVKCVDLNLGGTPGLLQGVWITDLSL